MPASANRLFRRIGRFGRSTNRYYSYPCIVIFESPYYSPNTVITEMAPECARERRYTDDSPPAESLPEAPGTAPFDPTPQEVVDRMLRLRGEVRDVLYDLGAGDGRW